MSIYTYNISKNLCEILGTEFHEIPELSDQNLYFNDLELLSEERIKNPSTAKFKSVLSEQERKNSTAAANAVKTGFKESEQSKAIKRIAQKKRWDKMSKQQRKSHGELSRAGLSEHGKIKSLDALLNSNSAARQKGFVHKKVICPFCNKSGGINAMKRFHFDNCKENHH